MIVLYTVYLPVDSSPRVKALKDKTEHEWAFINNSANHNKSVLEMDWSISKDKTIRQTKQFLRLW